MEGLPSDVLAHTEPPWLSLCAGKVAAQRGNLSWAPWTTPGPFRSSRVPRWRNLFHNSDLVKFNALGAGSAIFDTLPVLLRMPMVLLGLCRYSAVLPACHRHVRYPYPPKNPGISKTNTKSCQGASLCVWVTVFTMWWCLWYLLHTWKHMTSRLWGHTLRKKNVFILNSKKKCIYCKVKGSIKPVRTEMRLTLRLRLSPSTRPLRCHNVKMYIPVQIEIEADIKFGQDWNHFMGSLFHSWTR